jgi:hypothetical protein
MTRHARSIAVTAAVLLLGCGRPGDVVDPFSQPHVPPILTPLPALSFSVPAGGAAQLDFDGAEAGYLFATVEWQDPANNVVAVFTGRGCHSVNDALSGGCRDAEVQGSQSTCRAKPRTLTVSFLQPVALRLWIANTGSSAESGRVELMHCKDAPNCGATLSCAQCGLYALDRRSCR